MAAGARKLCISRALLRCAKMRHGAGTRYFLLLRARTTKLTGRIDSGSLVAVRMALQVRFHRLYAYIEASESQRDAAV